MIVMIMTYNNKNVVIAANQNMPNRHTSAKTELATMKVVAIFPSKMYNVMNLNLSISVNFT